MASPVPASLKSADITRFAHRAAQLEKVKPVVWYWSIYHIANQILEKGLHTADNEALTYTTRLMDELEQFKVENSTNDAVIDDVAGKAYVEQFGLETFSRAENAVRANKATRQTADTFQAAGTFLDLLAIWGPIEPEIAAKTKFAKYHALRIAKAVKAGEDPNLSNPKQSTPEDVLPQLDPNDAEVQALEGGVSKPRQPSVIDAVDEADKLQARLARTSSLDQSLHPSRDPSNVRQQRQPSVVEVADEADRLQNDLAWQSSLDESLHPSRAPSIPRSTGEAVSPLAPQDVASYYTRGGQPDVSPMEVPADRKPSIGGNYFPVVPPAQSAQAPDLPSAPTDFSISQPAGSFQPPDTPRDFSLPQAPTTFASQSQPPINAPISPSAPEPGANLGGHFQPSIPPGQQPYIPPNFTPQSQPRQTLPQAPPQSAGGQPFQYTPSTSIPQAHYPPPQPTAAAAAPPASIPTTTSNAILDEEAIMKAQKHARWAISALNFEDVSTAIRELEGALKVLGAR